MLNRFLHIILFLSITCSAYSQLMPLLDQGHLNGLAINPAYAGSQGALNVGIYSRMQWHGFEGAPRTSILSVHSPLRNKKVNLGLLVLGDRLGSKNEMGFLLNYAYRIELGNGSLAFGLAAGLTSLSYDLNSMRYTDQGDILIQDPSERALLPQFSVGSFFQTDRYYVGIAMPYFLNYSINEGKSKYQIGFSVASANYMLTAGYLFQVSESVELLPSVLLRTNPANNTQLDLHCNAIFKEKFWIGAGIRSNKSLIAILQFQVTRQLRMGYSYGYEFSELSSYQNGSHEVMLQYSFKYLLEVVSPRYF